MDPSRHRSSFSRLALGTAQLGMPYGVANRTGQPSAHTAEALVESCLARGLTCIDTAKAYGASESVLGTILAKSNSRKSLDVVSKGKVQDASLREEVEGSLQRLGLDRLAAWLLHDENQLGSWTPQAERDAGMFLRDGRVGSFGISVYSPEIALRAVERHGFTSVQFPASPMDRRFLRSGVMERLIRGGASLYIRSIYLQGLCLMSPSEVPPGIPHGVEAVSALADFCAARGLDRDMFCLHYVLHRTAGTGARVVIGMETGAQVRRTEHLFSAGSIAASHFDAWDALWPDDVESLVLPYRWNLRG